MMNKTFLKKHAVTFIIIGATFVIFSLGFLCGKHTAAEPPAKVEAAEARHEIRITENAEKYPSQKYNELTLTATAYCHCAECCGKSDGITATGTKATQGRTIAVDPAVIPYGAKVIIGGNTYIAEDCGGAIKGNKIDIYFNSHESALAFGKKQVKAIIEK